MSKAQVFFSTNQTLTASGTQTMLRITAGSAHVGKILKAYCGFNGITAADPPILVQLCRYTGDGTMSSVTGQKADLGRNEAIIATAGALATVEPTGAVVLDAAYVHPQGGSYTWNFGDTPGLIIPGTDSGSLTRLGIRLVVGTLTATTKVQASFIIEE